MKYIYLRTITILTLFVVLLISGCDSNLNPMEDQEIPGEVALSMDMTKAEEVLNVEVTEVQVTLSKSGTDEERSETYTPENGEVVATIEDLSPGLWSLKVELFDGNGDLLGDGETTVEIESGATAQAQIEISLGLVDPETGTLELHILWGYEERALVSDSEDCITFDPDEVRVEQSSGGLWRIVDESQIILNFGDEEDSELLANEGLRLFQEFAFTHYCFVGRPSPPMTYFLSHGIAPRGDAGEEDCITFDPDEVKVEQSSGGLWRIVDDSQIILNFGDETDSEELANEGADLIRKYKFSKYCFVGRPDPPMTYFKE